MKICCCWQIMTDYNGSCRSCALIKSNDFLSLFLLCKWLFSPLFSIWITGSDWFWHHKKKIGSDWKQSSPIHWVRGEVNAIKSLEKTVSRSLGLVLLLLLLLYPLFSLHHPFSVRSVYPAILIYFQDDDQEPGAASISSFFHVTL